jgi:hypothetical protein
MLVFTLFNILRAQAPVDPITSYEKLNLPQSAGSVLVRYTPSAEQRALRYRQSLAGAVKWYGEQLKVSVPVTLAVADRDTWEKVQPANPRNPPYFMPNSQLRKSLAGSIEGLVVLPARIEDFPNFENMQVAPDLLAEAISFHEAGHIFAHGALGLESRNPFVNELIANFFMVAYIRAGHPEFEFMNKDVAARLGAQKYRSLADLDYLYLDVGGANYAWFQFRLNELADWSLGGQDFATVIGKLKTMFPASATQSLPVEEILARLEKIRPGVEGMFADLAGPSILPRIAPSACTAVQRGGVDSILVLRNDSSANLAVSRESGQTLNIAAGTFGKLYGKAGESLKLAGGTCLKFGPGPALAAVSAP